jgi:hypothetical protein
MGTCVWGALLTPPSVRIRGTGATEILLAGREEMIYLNDQHRANLLVGQYAPYVPYQAASAQSYYQAKSIHEVSLSHPRCSREKPHQRCISAVDYLRPAEESIFESVWIPCPGDVQQEPDERSVRVFQVITKDLRFRADTLRASTYTLRTEACARTTCDCLVRGSMSACNYRLTILLQYGTDHPHNHSSLSLLHSRRLLTSHPSLQHYSQYQTALPIQQCRISRPCTPLRSPRQPDNAHKGCWHMSSDP